MSDKFAELKRLCSEAKDNGVDEVMIAAPWVLGDTYDEVMENLGLLAEAKLALRIVNPNNSST